MTAPTHFTGRVPLRIRRRPGCKTVVTPVVDGLPAHTTTRADPALLKALARAFRYQRMLDDGRYASIREMAAAEKLDRGYIGRLLQLTLLAPDIVEAIVEGRQAEGVTLPGLMKPFSEHWGDQRLMRRGQELLLPANRPHPSVGDPRIGRSFQHRPLRAASPALDGEDPLHHQGRWLEAAVKRTGLL